AELSSVKANLSEHVQITDNKSLPLTEERDQLNSTLTEVTKVHEELHHLSESNEGLAAELSSVKASLSEHLQKSLSLTKERDQLNSTLIEVTKELDKLQCLHNYKKTCPSGWNIFNCSCYLLSAQYDSWDKGREDCRRRGADLVVVDTPEEQTFVSGFTPYDIWIGLTDNEKEGVWKWVDGTPLNFRYWANNEPNNGGSRFGEENCAHISMVRRETGMMCHVAGPLSGPVKRELPSVCYDYVKLLVKTDLVCFLLLFFLNMGLCLTMLKSASM
ncbi:hypothetical protein INR49_026993, partial [Caranx melampygus]